MGRWMGKETNKNSKLTAADVAGLRERLNSWPPKSTVQIEADRFHVGLETIRRARRAETYRDVGDMRIPDSVLTPVLQSQMMPELIPDQDIIRRSQQKLFALLEKDKAASGEDILNKWYSDEEVEKRARANAAAVAAKKGVVLPATPPQIPTELVQEQEEPRGNLVDE